MSEEVYRYQPEFSSDQNDDAQSSFDSSGIPPDENRAPNIPGYQQIACEIQNGTRIGIIAERMNLSRGSFYKSISHARSEDLLPRPPQEQTHDAKKNAVRKRPTYDRVFPDLESGMPLSDIADKHGMTYAQVESVLSRAKASGSLPRPTPDETRKRKSTSMIGNGPVFKKIFPDLEAGLTTPQVIRRHGVSRKQVNNVLAQARRNNLLPKPTQSQSNDARRRNKDTLEEYTDREIAINDSWLEGTERRIKLTNVELVVILIMGSNPNEGFTSDSLSSVLKEIDGPVVTDGDIDVILNKVNSVTDAKIVKYTIQSQKSAIQSGYRFLVGKVNWTRGKI